MALCSRARAVVGAAVPLTSSALQVGLAVQIPALSFDVGHRGASSADAGLHAGSFLGGVVVGAMSALVVVGCLLERSRRLVECERAHESKPAASASEDSVCKLRAADGLESPEASPAKGAVIGPRRRSTEPPSYLSSIWQTPEEADPKPGESIHLFWPRCGFLVAMLMLQSVSSLILGGFDELIRDHTSLVYFLTMMVGVGGNAGSQSVVLAVRRLAVGRQVQIREQLLNGALLGLVIGPLAMLRAWVSGTGWAMVLTIGLSCVLTTVIATTCGTAIPMVLSEVQVDPAHAASMIQVLMDIVGIMVVCCTGVLVVSAFGN